MAEMPLMSIPGGLDAGKESKELALERSFSASSLPAWEMVLILKWYPDAGTTHRYRFGALN